MLVLSPQFVLRQLHIYVWRLFASRKSGKMEVHFSKSTLFFEKSHSFREKRTVSEKTRSSSRNQILVLRSKALIRLSEKQTLLWMEYSRKQRLWNAKVKTDNFFVSHTFVFWVKNTREKKLCEIFKFAGMRHTFVEHAKGSFLRKPFFFQRRRSSRSFLVFDITARWYTSFTL